MKRIWIIGTLPIVFLLAFVTYVALLSCSESKSPVKAVPAVSAAGDGETWTQLHLPDKDASMPPATLSGNSFSGFKRFPAEEKVWLSMVNDTAYFRDEKILGRTNIWSADSGETWTTTVIRPDGSTIIWTPITFHSVYGDETNCFVSRDGILCNTTSCWVEWETTSQCYETGEWIWSFLNNGTVFHTDTCTTVPRINPSKVLCNPAHDQTLYNDPVLHHHDNVCLCNTNPLSADTCDPSSCYDIPATIAEFGCELAAACMVFEYHGLHVEPPALNSWLKSNNGFDHKGRPQPKAIEDFAVAHGIKLFYTGTKTASALNSSLCSKGPTMTLVQRQGSPVCDHCVVVTGKDSSQTTYTINDPWGAVQAKLTDRYTTLIGEIITFEDTTYYFTHDLSLIRINKNSPVELVIVDQESRRTGVDPLTGQSYDEIPNSFYGDCYIGDLYSEARLKSTWLEIVRPPNGQYELIATGTGDGTYSLGIGCYDTQVGNHPSEWNCSDIPITSGEIHSYIVNFDKTPGAENYVTGGFLGGRQRPRDIDSFLSYISPNAIKTSLPETQTSFSLHILYGNTILPATFKATLNSDNVAGLFSPSPGGYEIVSIPLIVGENVLILSVNGETPDRMMMDEDILTFVVK